MTSGAVETEREHATLAAARAGDEAAFRELTEPHRRELHVHCYRMTGSLHEAEDLVQETMLRAWRRLATYAGRASFRAWLYAIATNACLDALAARERRMLPQAVAQPDDPRAVPAPALDVAWLEPYPDRLLDPAEEAERRESVRLAFVAALQHLPPRQRAALILRDVLDWPANDVASFLGTTVASVNSALRRARVAMPAAQPATNADVDATVVERYVAAFHAHDVAALAELLREDVELAMPPTPSWYRGRDAVSAFLGATFRRFADLSLVPTTANAAPAAAVFLDGAPLAIKVFGVDGGRIVTIIGFSDTSLFPYFELPPPAP